MVYYSVSNGTGQCNFSGQRDKLKILPVKFWDGTRDGTVRDFDPSRGTKRDIAEKDVLKQEKDILKQKRMF